MNDDAGGVSALSAGLVEWIDQQDGTRADVIEAALLKAHKLRAPKD